MKLLWQLDHTKLAHVLVFLELVIEASSLSSEINELIMVEFLYITISTVKVFGVSHVIYSELPK